MLCWKCKQEMTTEYANSWHKNKAGDRIYSMTLICWECGTIFFGRMTEINREHGDADTAQGALEVTTSVCNDNVSKKIRESRAHVDRIL